MKYFVNNKTNTINVTLNDKIILIFNTIEELRDTAKNLNKIADFVESPVKETNLKNKKDG